MKSIKLFLFCVLCTVAGINFFHGTASATFYDTQTTSECFFEKKESRKCCEVINMEASVNRRAPGYKDCSVYDKSPGYMWWVFVAGVFILVASIWALNSKRASKRKVNKIKRNRRKN